MTTHGETQSDCWPLCSNTRRWGVRPRRGWLTSPIFLLMTLFWGLPLAKRGSSQSSHITGSRNKRWRIIDGTDDIVIDHATLTVLLDSRCAGPGRGRSNRMDHEVGVCCCEPRRCLRLELVDVSTCAQRNRVTGVCKLAEEGEGMGYTCIPTQYYVPSRSTRCTPRGARASMPLYSRPGRRTASA